MKTKDENYESIQNKDTDEEINDENNIENISEKLDDNIQIKDMNINVQKGEFVCIIGEVGSGKSSLLSAILGNMIYLDQQMISSFKDQVIDADFRHKLNNESLKHHGIVKLGGSISFVQQVPWIQNKTIRDNILFGLPLDEAKYNRVVEICQLASDLDMLPGGDLTEIGEKGINLSGGQKARVSLARAVYADRDIVLMDDPISALDSNVKKQVFEQVLLGELRHKTRVLVTHAVDFIDRADRIVIMEEGKIKHIGTYDELQHSEEMKHIIDIIIKTKLKNQKQKHSNLDDFDDSEQNDNSRNNSVQNNYGSKLTEEENDEDIDVPWTIYFKFFFSNGSWIFYISLIPLFILYSFFYVYDTIFTANWVKTFEDHNDFWEYFWYCLFFPIGFSA